LQANPVQFSSSANTPGEAGLRSGMKDPHRAQKNDHGHFSERGHRGPVRVSRRAEPASPGLMAEPLLSARFAGKPAPTGPLPQGKDSHPVLFPVSLDSRQTLRQCGILLPPQIRDDHFQRDEADDRNSVLLTDLLNRRQ